jgi:DNA mismatch repair protein MutS2
MSECDDAPLAPGDWVEIEGMAGVGRVTSVDARRKKARVQVGEHEWTLPLGRLRRTDEAPAQDRPTNLVRVTGARAVLHEIDLHGMIVEDALAAADRAIDQAVVGNLRQLRIIHGHGTGALRTAIRRMLATHPQVERYRFGDPHEGGLACTVAELRSAKRRLE